jgi:hypothetical protein
MNDGVYVLRIRHIQSGKYANGATKVEWVDEGALGLMNWLSMDSVREHLHSMNIWHFESGFTLERGETATIDNHPYKNAEIVSYKIVETDTCPIVDDDFRRQYVINTLQEEIEGAGVAKYLSILQDSMNQ